MRRHAAAALGLVVVDDQPSHGVFAFALKDFVFVWNVQLNEGIAGFNGASPHVLRDQVLNGFFGDLRIVFVHVLIRIRARRNEVGLRPVFVATPAKVTVDAKGSAGMEGIRLRFGLRLRNVDRKRPFGRIDTDRDVLEASVGSDRRLRLKDQIEGLFRSRCETRHIPLHNPHRVESRLDEGKNRRRFRDALPGPHNIEKPANLGI